MNSSDTDDYRNRIERWYLENERWRSEIEPLRQMLTSHLDHTVSYGQMALRSVLLLNGGGLLAVPAFAKLYGSMWGQGTIPVLITIAAFALGTIFAGGGIACSFFSFLALQNMILETIERTAKGLKLEFSEEPQKDDLDVLGKLTKKESKSQKSAGRFDFWAKFCGLSAFFLFLVGALVAFYIISGGPPEAVST